MLGQNGLDRHVDRAGAVQFVSLVEPREYSSDLSDERGKFQCVSMSKFGHLWPFAKFVVKSLTLTIHSSKLTFQCAPHL